MIEQHENRISEVMVSFSYSRAKQASRCNDRIHQLIEPVIVPEIEAAFEQVSNPLFQIELDKVEIDLGRISEDEITESLGLRIRKLLIQMLSLKLKEKLGTNSLLFQTSNEIRWEDFALAALRMFFLKGYFPDWLDKNKGLYPLLEEMITSFPASIGKLVREVSLKSEVARRRIAFLATEYFDRILSVLVPEEVDWIIGYRNSYLKVHQSESKLPGSFQNLEQALNLFILNFIVDDSGTRFNRLSFSERSLKAIAAHYNLDFQVFLSEIKAIVSQSSPKNQLDQDFKEIIRWVGEKNLIAEHTIPNLVKPTSSQFLNWLNYSQEDPNLQSWLETLEGSSMLFHQLSATFPQFWNFLDEKGFENLLNLVGNSESDQWQTLVQKYAGWAGQEGQGLENNRTELSRQLFDLAWKETSSGKLVLDSLEEWFAVLLLHANEQTSLTHSAARRLLKIGMEHGVTAAPIIWAKIGKIDAGIAETELSASKLLRSVAAPINDYSTENSDSLRHELKIQEHTLRNFLISGSLGKKFQDLNENDLVGLLSGLLKEKRPWLVQWIRQLGQSNDIAVKSRLWRLIRKVNRKHFRDFVEQFGGRQTTILLRVIEEINQWLPANLHATNQLEELIWSSFLKEAGKENIIRTAESAIADLSLIRAMLLLLSQNPDLTEANRRSISGASKTLNQLRSFLLFSAQTTFSKSPFYTSLFDFYIAKKGSSQIQLLRQTPKNRVGKFDLAKLTIQSQSRLEQALKNLVLSGPIQELTSKRISNLSMTKQEAMLIVHSDFKFLIKQSISGTANWKSRTEKKEAIRRIFHYYQLDQNSISGLFRKYRSHLVYLLVDFKATLNSKDWNVLAARISLHFPKEFRHFKKLADLLHHEAFISLFKQIKANDQRYSPENVEDLLTLFNPSQLKNREVREALSESFHWNMGFVTSLTFLLTLSSSVFPRKSLHLKWNKLLMLSALNYGVDAGNSTGTTNGRFWGDFIYHLKSNFSAVDLRELDWSYILQSKSLSKSGKTQLTRLIYGQNPDRVSHSKIALQDQYASALLFLKEKGYLPWWSPIQTKMGLVTVFLNQLEYSGQVDGLAMLFSEGEAKNLVSGLTEDELKRLTAVLSDSKHRKFYAPFILVVQSRIRQLSRREMLDHRPAEPSSLGQKETAFLVNKSPAQLAQWIAKQINSSREEKLVSHWFSYDPRIQTQLKTLLSWSSWMFFGNLTPGRWKVLLLTYAFEYYGKKRNRFSNSFFTGFLLHLTSSHSSVNWKRLFHQLLQKSDFVAASNSSIRAEILSVFPTEKEEFPSLPTVGDCVRVGNAGLILCWPFLSVLFSRLSISKENMIPESMQSRAVYLLQYLVFGEYDFPEYELVLNKTLVGMKSSQHLEKVTLTLEEMDMTESLLVGMRSNWEKMKNASVAAIRETFLQREGTLEFSAEGFILRVPKTGVDVLLDSVPWNIAVIRMPWMEKSLDVKWR